MPETPRPQESEQEAKPTLWLFSFVVFTSKVFSFSRDPRIGSETFFNRPYYPEPDKPSEPNTASINMPSLSSGW